jgi:hypothetical protein
MHSSIIYDNRDLVYRRVFNSYATHTSFLTGKRTYVQTTFNELGDGDDSGVTEKRTRKPSLSPENTYGSLCPRK